MFYESTMLILLVCRCLYPIIDAAQSNFAGVCMRYVMYVMF